MTGALPPAVFIHSLADARLALAHGAPVTLLSDSGAGAYAGCRWWKALVAMARAEHPEVECVDILDCADATGFALAALRIGITRLVLWPEAPGRDAVVAIARQMGGCVLPEAPTAAPPPRHRGNRDKPPSTG